ncbi:hypothetical protein QF000_001712 [Paraburkholderia atlantica]|uniref:hypothetical protein n=1 Tax=Paraburkholderia atlantica TaxID=2654982 RepID=UPI003D2508E7
MQSLHRLQSVGSRATSHPKPALHRTYWKPHEIAPVVARAKELLAASPKLSPHVAVRQAQEAVLPPERWRAFKQARDTERLFAAVPEVMPPAPAKPAPVPEPSRAFPRAIQPPLVPPEERHVEPPPYTPVPAQAADPAIVRAVAEQLMPALAATVSECVMRLSDVLAGIIRNADTQVPLSHATGKETESRGPDSETIPPRDRPPRVTVVGLIHQQERDVEQAFSGVIDFVFVKAQKDGRWRPRRRGHAHKKRQFRSGARDDRLHRPRCRAFREASARALPAHNRQCVGAKALAD